MEVPLASVVLDTSALIHSLELVKELYAHAAVNRLELLVPQTTFLELDRIKDREKTNKQLVSSVRKAINYLDETIRTQEVQIMRGQKTEEVIVPNLKADSAILDAALYVMKKKCRTTFLLSKDHSLCLRANVENIEAIELGVFHTSDEILQFIAEFTAESMDLDAPEGVELDFTNPFTALSPKQPVNSLVNTPFNTPFNTPVNVQKERKELKELNELNERNERNERNEVNEGVNELYQANGVNERHEVKEPERKRTVLESIYSRANRARAAKEKENVYEMLGIETDTITQSKPLESIHRPKPSSNVTKSTPLESIHKPKQSGRQRQPKKSKPALPEPVSGANALEANVVMLVDFYIRQQFSADELDMLKYKQPQKYADLAKLKGYYMAVDVKQFTDQMHKLKPSKLDRSAAEFLKKLAKQDKRYADIYTPHL